MADARPTAPRRLLYDCLKCPAYCCSYQRISVSARDLDRLARHLGTDRETVIEKYTKMSYGERVLRHQKDDIYPTICIFFDRKERRCGVYEARPAVCREYPEEPRCGYWEFLKWEREHQDDPDFVPLKRTDFK